MQIFLLCKTEQLALRTERKHFKTEPTAPKTERRRLRTGAPAFLAESKIIQGKLNIEENEKGRQWIREFKLILKNLEAPFWGDIFMTSSSSFRFRGLMI